MKKLERPVFSMIVPVYNTEPYLAQCVDSLVAQTYQDFEIILVDDGSTDESGRICDSYQSRFQNVKVLHKKNAGLVKARESGIKMAQGKYVGFVDSDDWVDKKLLSAVDEIIKKYKTEIVSFNVLLEFSDRQEKQLGTIPYGFYSKQDMQKEIYPVMLYNKKEKFYNFGIYPSVSNKIFLKEVLENSQCKDGRITMGEDASCTYASLLAANSLYLMPDYFYHYRQNENSMTNLYDRNRFQKYKLLLEYLDKILDKELYDMKQQLLVHKAFRIKHAILNESKAPVNILEKRKELERKMEQYHFQNVFKELGNIKAGIATKIFVFMAKHQMYGSLIFMCEIFKKVHRY